MTHRLGSVLGGIAAVAVLGTVLFGAGGGGIIALLPLVAVALIGFTVVTKSRLTSRVADPGWLAVDPLLVPARPGSVPAPWAVARAIGRAEARELASSGAFGVGIGFCVLLLVLFGGVWAGENTEPWFALARQAPWYCLPAVGLTVVAAHRATTRPRRDGTDELFGTCPVREETRTVGLLLSAGTAVGLLVAFLAIGATLIALRGAGTYGSLAADDWFDLVSAPLLGAGGVALGVALGRWLHFGLVPVVAVGLVGLASIAISESGGHNWNPYVDLSTQPTIEAASPVFVSRVAAWHLVWILGLTALVAMIGIARHRRDRLVALLAVMTVAVVVASGIGATRPMSERDAARIATAVAEPAAMQDCTELSRVAVCIFPIHQGMLDDVLLDAGPVAAAIPEVAGPLTLRQRFHDQLADLPPEVRRLLTADDLVVPEGEIPIGFSFDGHPMGDAGYVLGLGAVGLPTRTGYDLMPTPVAGQARGVIALWLATRGRSPEDVRTLTSSPLPDSTDPFDRGALEEGNCAIPTVVWSGQDLEATRAVVALPDAAVGRVVAGEWERWLDPATSTDELLTALGLPGVGPFDDVVPRPGNPC